MSCQVSSPVLSPPGRNTQSSTQPGRGCTATVRADAVSVLIENVHLTDASFVLATLQKDRTGVWVRAAVPDAANAAVTVHLNKAPGQSAKVAWFVLRRSELRVDRGEAVGSPSEARHR